MINEDEIFDNIAYDTARMLSSLQNKYRGHEVMVANALVDSLGAYISLAAVDPSLVLPLIANRLRETDYEQIKLRHYGHKLAIAQDIERPVVGDIINMGAPRGRA